MPIENSLEGTVNATVDALSAESRLIIVGEQVLPVTQCLIAREPAAFAQIEAVHSHPQGLAQCARFLHEQMPDAQLLTAPSTAAAVRGLADAPRSHAAIGSRYAAELHDAVVLREGIEDEPGNETRFAWLAREGDPAPFPEPPANAAWKTSIVFQGSGDVTPGWLVRCLSEFAFRGVNLVKIESRPARSRLGHYVFLVDCEGPLESADVGAAVEARARALRPAARARQLPGRAPQLASPPRPLDTLRGQDGPPGPLQHQHCSGPNHAAD